MLVVIVLAARWIVRRFRLAPSSPGRFRVGLVALGLVLVTEMSVVLRLQGMTIEQCLATRDRLAGTVYVVMLVVFALMPALVHRARSALPPAPTR